MLLVTNPLKRLLFFTWVVLLGSCATQSTQLSKYPIKFEPAMRALANNLLESVKDAKNTANIVLDPFVDVASGNVVKVSRHIEQIILEEGKTHFSQFNLARITPQNLREAHYVLNGSIDFKNYEIVETEKPEKYYYIAASIVDLGTGKIIANAKSWIAEADLDYTPTALYEDSPTYLKDKLLESQIATSKAAVGDSADLPYYDNLDTQALLVKAATVYEKAEYDQALLLFNKAEERTDGKIMRTYAGLYETHLKLKQTEAAEIAFGKLLAVSVQETKKLNVKFLFAVDSTDFVNDTNLKNEYTLWIRQIGRYFSSNEYCFNIVGHCSKTGSTAYNDKLSLNRAQKVQQLLTTHFSPVMQRSQAVGKGFKEIIVGSGTDDARDAIDRRVEFLVVDCATVKKP